MTYNVLSVKYLHYYFTDVVLLGLVFLRGRIHVESRRIKLS